MQKNQVSPETDLAREALAEAWVSEPSPREDGASVYQLLLASRELLKLTKAPEILEAHESSAASPAHRTLRLLVGALKAERGLFFEIRPGKAGSPPSAGEALAAVDADGEPVRIPQTRVPPEAVARVARSGLPEAGTLAHEIPENPTPTHFVLLPVEWEGSLQGAVYLENRFKELDLSHHSIRLARAHCGLLGSIVSWDRLRKSHASLWIDVQRLREEVSARQESVPAERQAPRRVKRSGLKGDYSAIVGSSPCMLEIFRVLDRISNSNAPVLISGDSGTGKELVARAVHDNSPRRGKVFVSENCGALTETLLESELFGYVKGAFTGATKDSKGLFELAEGGTLFLDEVGDMSPGMQKKLLRVLQEGVIRRVGGKEYIPVDVRIISATNKDLLEEVRSGKFREDLYYRLNVISIRVPSLRERKEDIPELVEAFLDEIAKETGIRKNIEPAALQRLVQYNWPGNVRELKNEIRRLHALAEGDITLRDLSETILSGQEGERPFHTLGTEIYQMTLKEATERLEREMIRNAIIQARGNKSLVAKMLQVPKTSLYNKINKYGLDKL